MESAANYSTAIGNMMHKVNSINFLRFFFYSACLVLISGCGLTSYSYRDSNPVVADDTNSAKFWSKVIFSDRVFTTFSTTASRRIVLVLENKNNSIVCSEPSPDVGEAFASAVSDSIKAKLPMKGVTSVDLTNDYARSLKTQIQALIYRTQGLQLYRNAMHGLCVDRLNGWFDNTQDSQDSKRPQSYGDFRKYYFDKSIDLINEEIKYIRDVANMRTGDINSETTNKTEQNSKTENEEVKK